MNHLAESFARSRERHIAAVVDGNKTAESLYTEYRCDIAALRGAAGDAAVADYESLMQRPLLQLGRARGVHV